MSGPLVRPFVAHMRDGSRHELEVLVGPCADDEEARFIAEGEIRAVLGPHAGELDDVEAPQ